MPYHIDGGGQFSYHAYNSGQWADVSSGLIFGYKLHVPRIWIATYALLFQLRATCFKRNGRATYIFVWFHMPRAQVQARRPRPPLHEQAVQQVLEAATCGLAD